MIPGDRVKCIGTGLYINKGSYGTVVMVYDTETLVEWDDINATDNASIRESWRKRGHNYLSLRNNHIQ